MIQQLRERLINIFSSQITKVICILLIVWIVGAIGILFLEAKNQPDFNSLANTLWWTIVTMTTVGYGDMAPKGEYSRLFAIFIMLTGISISALLTGTLSSIFVAKKIREGRGMEAIKEKDHIIICGWNPSVDEIIQSIFNIAGKNTVKIVLVNNLSIDEINSISAKYSGKSLRHVRGDYTSDVILNKTNLKNARAVIIVSDINSVNQDERTVLCTLTTKNIAPHVKVIAHLNDRDNMPHLHSANVDEIILNDKFNTFMAANHVMEPGVPQTMNKLIDPRAANLLSKSIPEEYIGKTFRSLFDHFIEKHGWICIGLFHEAKKISFSDFLSAESSALDAFIERKLKEAGKSLAGESQSSVLINPGKDYIIKQGTGAIVIS